MRVFEKKALEFKLRIGVLAEAFESTFDQSSTHSPTSKSNSQGPFSCCLPSSG